MPWLVDMHFGSARKQFCHKALAPDGDTGISVWPRCGLPLLSRAEHGERVVYQAARISLRGHVGCSQIRRVATDRVDQVRISRCLWARFPFHRRTTPPQLWLRNNCSRICTWNSPSLFPSLEFGANIKLVHPRRTNSPSSTAPTPTLRPHHLFRNSLRQNSLHQPTLLLRFTLQHLSRHRFLPSIHLHPLLCP
jgi:hypothetical protein